MTPQAVVDRLVDDTYTPEDIIETKQEIKKAFENDTIKFLVKDGKTVGFFNWVEVRKDGKLYIYLSNLEIDPEARGEINLLIFRKYLRDRYPEIVFGYWHRDKSNKFYYAH